VSNRATRPPRPRRRSPPPGHRLGYIAGPTKHRTYELSGGEQQRVAIARALVKRPTLILADEPTGQLDSLTGASIIALLKEITAQTGVTVVVASHDPNVHEAADWIFELQDGRLVATVDQTGENELVNGRRGMTPSTGLRAGNETVMQAIFD
jgi:ABC-type glutathione transport system ATPase component